MVYKIEKPFGKYRWGVKLPGFRCELYTTRKDALEALAFFKRCGA